MKKIRTTNPKDKDTHCCPSVDCKYHIDYDRCSNSFAPSPGHSRCIGSRACEEWILNSLEISHGRSNVH